MSEKSQPGPRNSSNSLGLFPYKFGITVLYNPRMDSNKHNGFNILLCDIKELERLLGDIQVLTVVVTRTQ